MRRENVRPEPLPRPSPIKYVTENGYSIVRLCDMDSSIVDRPEDCRFLVAPEGGREREVKVEFTAELIERIQIKRRTPLSRTSKFWVTCAENCLATYLWETDNLPPDERLTISDLYVDEFLLAAHWADPARNEEY